MVPRRRSTLGRWLLALLLLAFLAWGVGQLRSGRGARPELGVGDLRGGGAAAAAVPPGAGSGAPPAPEPPRLPATDPAPAPAPGAAETGAAQTGEARTGER